MATDVVRTIDWPGRGADPETFLGREWLVTNGLGGFASGSVVGVPTRRYHSLLVAALPAPHGRIVMLSHLAEEVEPTSGGTTTLSGEETSDTTRDVPGSSNLVSFQTELGLPVWCYEVGGVVIEKRIVMPHQQNTVRIIYRLVHGDRTIWLRLRPALHFRPLETPVNAPLERPYVLTSVGEHFELTRGEDLPPLRMALHGERRSFTVRGEKLDSIYFRVENRRGYADRGDLWAPGHFSADLSPDSPSVSLVASTEPWEVIEALSTDETYRAETRRRTVLLSTAGPSARDSFAAELVLAADQFVITPAGRIADAARARAAGDELRSVIAGYHWFTDWGRDTMISLPGLTLTTGRHVEAGYILRTFAQYVRDGLIPNMFPDGQREGLYHTADATLWYFHALDRYVAATGDVATLALLLPLLRDIVHHHINGTRFGIGVDPADGLLRQGAEGYQLTWMDAKVDDWVVTPRRGKAVEINALWYNALRLIEGWLREHGDATGATFCKAQADRAEASFNERFWYAEGGYLYDVVDGEAGDDAACRPNQIFAVALPHAVLARERWQPVVETVRERLLTPYGLRSLAPDSPDYKPSYFGDLRARDAAYHQGTVWAWLIGPYVDAWLRLHPDDRAGARQLLSAFEGHLAEAGVGSISEIFDAEPPYRPRGCIAQAWSVAEVLRSWARTASETDSRPGSRPRTAARAGGR